MTALPVATPDQEVHRPREYVERVFDARKGWASYTVKEDADGVVGTFFTPKTEQIKETL